VKTFAIREIPLTQGLVAIVDEQDFHLVSTYRWYAHRHEATAYARTSCPGDRNRKIYLHRLIMSAPRGVEVDHRDGNGLNCTRANLRFATRSQQVINRRDPKTTRSISGVVGVTYDKRLKKWGAHITANGLRRWLGWYAEKEGAVDARRLAEKTIHGDFAVGNRA
jgi:hypothetical protein